MIQLGFPTCRIYQERGTNTKTSDKNHRYGSNCPHYERPISTLSLTTSRKKHKLPKEDLRKPAENVSDVECLGVLKNGITKKTRY